MTLLQLQYFHALAQALHYTRTSEQLHISQPSLSYAIAELEKELGVKLFQKEKRVVTLTAYGQCFLPYADKALSLIHEGCTALKTMAGDATQVVRMGYFHSISASFIPALIESFYLQEGTRNIRFQFEENTSYDILSQIQSGALDLGFSVHQAEWAQTAAVIRQPLYLAVPANHPLAVRQSVSFVDFAREPQIMLEHSSNLRTSINQIFSQHGMIPNVVFEVRECNAALQYVSLEFGVSILPQVPAMDSDKISVLPISNQDKEFVRTVYLVRNKNRPLSPVAQKVFDHVTAHYAIHEASGER